ncbi:MAG: ribonucleoside-diphosphate reductase subunit alpha, partial [Gammaproteobacteria bacterium]|nr:ribonucleoside-diphosphate reductase subunit alpha [Gammaproteobacteria bacterium]
MSETASPIGQQRPSQAITSSLQVIKRTGDAVPFDASKISIAMTRAFLAVEGQQASGSARVRDSVNEITADILQRLARRLPSGGSVQIEEIQDLVELGLMRHGFQKIARAYVLYREEHSRQRDQQQTPTRPDDSLRVLDADGSESQLNLHELDAIIHWACQDVPDVDADTLIRNTRKSLFNGMKASDVPAALIMTARPLIERDPGYAFVTARLLLNNLWSEVVTALALGPQTGLHYRAEAYPALFIASLHACVERELLAPQLLKFDLEKLAAALRPERDKLFSYLGLQTLYDRYFLHDRVSRLELPQTFFMRVAMGLAVNEDDPTARAIEFYNVLSRFDYMTSTPTLFNAGTLHPQLSSCYLTTVPDDLEGIYNALRDNALLSKWAGGLGNDWTPVRALGAAIKGTNGESQGIVPFLKV